MRASEFDILILPGLGGGTPEHWYARWAVKLSTARRVEQRDFNAPRLNEWTAAIEKAIGGARRPVALVGHSLGVLSAIHCTEKFSQVKGAFFVAAPSASAARQFEGVDPAFARPIAKRLPFPTVLVASRNDPYCPYIEAEKYASCWGAVLADAHDAGHINPDSGYGPWPEGLMKFAHFLSTLQPEQAPSAAFFEKGAY